MPSRCTSSSIPTRSAPAPIPYSRQELRLRQLEFERAEERYSTARAAQDKAGLEEGTASDVVRQRHVLFVPALAPQEPEPALRVVMLTVAVFHRPRCPPGARQHGGRGHARPDHPRSRGHPHAVRTGRSRRGARREPLTSHAARLSAAAGCSGRRGPNRVGSPAHHILKAVHVELELFVRGRSGAPGRRGRPVRPSGGIDAVVAVPPTVA